MRILNKAIDSEVIDIDDCIIIRFCTYTTVCLTFYQSSTCLDTSAHYELMQS